MAGTQGQDVVEEVNLGLTASWIAASVRSSSPLMLVLLGETLTQRVGIVNLGVEGQMLAGACFGFGVAAHMQDPITGLLAGALAGLILSVLHGVLCIHLRVNQIASGLSVMMLGMGVTSYVGQKFVGGEVSGLASLADVAKSNIFWQPIMTQLTWTAPVALILPLFAGIFLYRTRTGLRWRTVGESIHAAQSLGIKTRFAQWQGVLIGGLLSGYAGAVLSIDYTQTWAQDMTKGVGLIAVGLVIVARWNPFLVLPIALLFGIADTSVLRLQAAAINTESYLLQASPYVFCLLVLVVTRLRASHDNRMPAGLKAVFSDQ